MIPKSYIVSIIDDLIKFAEVELKKYSNPMSTAFNYYASKCTGYEDVLADLFTDEELEQIREENNK